MACNYYASSPTVILSPQHASHYFGDNSGFQSTHQSQQTNNDITMTSRRPVRPKFPRPPSLNYLSSSPPKAAGRKRLREETMDEPQEDQLPHGAIVRPAEPPKPRGEPVYGPGMTLIYPDDPGFNIAAESQTGTWAEMKHEQQETVNKSARPDVVARKSQRMFGASSPTEQSSSKLTAVMGPINDGVDTSDLAIDQLNLILGIGWKRLPDEQTDAVRGWERYIFNHYNVGSPTILLQNEGLHAYLVRTQNSPERFWLFKDDLSACQYIGDSENEVITSLQQPTLPSGQIIYAQSRASSMMVDGAAISPGAETEMAM